MCKEKKVKTVRTFINADNIPCLIVDDLKTIYPRINELIVNQRSFESYHWYTSTIYGVNSKRVMTCNDAQSFVLLYDRTLKRCKDENVTIEDIAIEMVASCSVCDRLLFPDDEAYNDEDSGETLCDNHSITNEVTGNYKKSY